jgi:HD-GYP domain-containing protein (c-di-GMP phosphodiesterase class II)
MIDRPMFVIGPRRPFRVFSSRVHMSPAVASPTSFTYDRAPLAVPADAGWKDALADLQMYFGVDFSLWDGTTGELLRRGADQPPGDELLFSALAQAAAQGKVPQFIGYEDCAVLLAVPLRIERQPARVAVAAFATRHPDPAEMTSATARLLGLSPSQTSEWLRRQTLWTAEALLRLATAVLDKRQVESQAAARVREVEDVSANLATTYEHISLLYDLIEHLRISHSEEELGDVALTWLRAYLPVESAVLQYLPVASEDAVSFKARTRTVWLADDACPIDSAGFSHLVDWLELAADPRPYVANPRVTGLPEWPCPGVRELVVAPMCEGSNLFGWLAAFNHRDGLEFGSIEASLFRSMGVILGIHCGNRELYRQEDESLANVVRSLTSAIDAKDAYTCGHSERVARIAVRLAKELGWDGEQLNTIYMTGLLHDIGKIGIQEGVLRKQGGLTDEEYGHIKTHPELGRKILADLKPLGEVLLGVLHHHERWNGRGYPAALAGEQIPEIARILAVADSYDAMTSNRPYRQGMPLEKVHRIFEQGRGTQWDPRVIDAYFRAQHHVARLCREERAKLAFDVQSWL